ncbi:unnamed protein product [Didymodactylos carnosus]|uniref:Tyrosine-protein phosphatase domain-containing protein n=1 Tax=Didymodactylos carnosus TaxID=1234261 RepID=A0A8S2IDG3_9BILA|nr:unnamed protein product [Didymodactylos carnosus]CAF0972184.1 unnamed protein product [Didymodactylos carnosus]CAF3743523.1 unnamed protein product [Didymodactylos carnosus]CAF3743538.1 unnamed protein product [Didymodactylos carnosus]
MSNVPGRSSTTRTTAAVQNNPVEAMKLFMTKSVDLIKKEYCKINDTKDATTEAAPEAQMTGNRKKTRNAGLYPPSKFSRVKLQADNELGGEQSDYINADFVYATGNMHHNKNIKPSADYIITQGT